MIDRYARMPKQVLYRPLARRLKLSPSLVTAAGLVAGLLCAVAAALGQYSWSFGLWILNRALDGLDGELAREQGTQSDLGGYLDIVADFAVYTAIPLGLACSSQDRLAWPLTAVMVGAFFINAASLMYLAALLEKRGQGAAHLGEKTSVTMPPALVEGGETVIFYSLFLLFPDQLVGLFSLMACLVGVNVMWRLHWAWRHLESPARPGLE